ncbi:MAG: MFS transporter [Kordiimonas sp.]
MSRFFRANSQMWIVFGLTAVCSMAITLFPKNIIYYTKYELDDVALGGTALILLTVGKAVSQLLWIKIAAIAGKKKGLQVAHVSLALLLIGFYLTVHLSIWLFLLYVFLIGCAVGGIYMLNWAILPDIIEYGEWKTGIRIEATVFGLFTLLNKVSIGLGVFMLSLLLGMAGFEANKAQTPQAADAISLLMCLLPTLGSFVSLMLLGRYKISEEAHDQMVENLEKRKRPSLS